MKCQYCKRIINGYYYKTSKNNILCVDCKKILKFCNVCGNFVNKIFKINNLEMCSTCLTKIKKCYICKEFLLNNFYEIKKNKKKYLICPSCKDLYKKCSICDFPILNILKAKVKDNNIICEDCFKKALKCEICEKYINNKYYILEKTKKIICKDCFSKKDFCSKCGKITKTLKKIGKTSFCLNCINTVPECSFCHNYISGKYYIQNNKNFCLKCYRQLAKCSFCNFISDDLKKDGEYLICKKCLPEMKKCKTCNILIKGRYWSISNEIFCEKCKSTNRLCDICRKPLGIKKWSLTDGRTYCEECKASGIFSNVEATNIEEKIKFFLKNKFNIYLEKSLKVKMIKRKELINISKTRKSIGFCIGSILKNEIYIQEALPEALFYITFAHEYTHAWQNENKLNNSTKAIVEGFAEWIAYKVLINFNFVEQVKNFGQTQDIYGIGFQKILKIEKKFGEKNVIENVKKYGSVNFKI